MPQAIDYAALAEQARKTAPPIDYAALGEQARKGGGPDFQTTNERDASGQPVVRDAQGNLIEMAQRFGSNFARNVLPSTTPSDYIEGPKYALQHPMDSIGLLAKALWDAHVAQAGKAVESSKGIITAPDLQHKMLALDETLGHGLATVIPFMGPAAANAGEQIGSGDIAGGLGSAAGVLAPAVVPHVSGRLTAPIREFIADKAHASALKGVEKAINPTRVDTKVRTARIAPQILERRVTASSLPNLEAQAVEKSAAAGADVEAALAPHAKTTVDTIPIIKQLEDAKADYIGTGDKGQKVINDPARVKAIQQIQDTVEAYGDDISVESMVKFRRNLDQVVEAGKGFTTPKASVKAWAAREGRTALRDQLSQAVPDLDKVNAEYAFWQTLEDVTHATNQRRTGQNGSLLPTIAGGAGAVVGEMIAPGSGTVGKGIAALVGAKGAASLKRLIDSPGYRLWSSVQKERLADALANRNGARAKGLIAAGLDAAGTTSRTAGRVMSGRPTPKVADATDRTDSRSTSGRVTQR